MMMQARGQLGDEDLEHLSAAVRVAEPEGDILLMHRDADYDDRARYRHLLAQHRMRHEVQLRPGLLSFCVCLTVRALTGKRLELSTPESVEMVPVIGFVHASTVCLIVFTRWRQQHERATSRWEAFLILVNRWISLQKR